ncbi:dynein axonemal heavy chain 14 isoform X3 [Columba livia]|uniref:dynein axonemal heavy chain 14 isoform X3 n=1 Tax=Columba livia TaxID=8932 RepID=UPI0031B9F0BF
MSAHPEPRPVLQKPCREIREAAAAPVQHRRSVRPQQPSGTPSNPQRSPHNGPWPTAVGPSQSADLSQLEVTSRSAAMEMDEERLMQMEEQNKMLKEKLVSRLRFEAERTESSSVEQKYPILRTAVYRGSTERKYKAPITEEGMCFGNVPSGTHKEGRKESVCQPTSTSEHVTVKLKGSMTKPTAFRSEGVEHGFGISPSSPVHDNTRKTEMQTSVLEPSDHKKTREQQKLEKSYKKPVRTRVYSYDRTAIDDDVITHILRLRGKLGWETKLTSREWLARKDDMAKLQDFKLTEPLQLKDSGEYIYCLQRNRNNFKAPYNPYDLQPVSTNTAMQKEEYWTVSASFVAKFSSCHKIGETEIKPVLQWLQERQLYYRLIDLNFFSNFRLSGSASGLALQKLDVYFPRLQQVPYPVAWLLFFVCVYNEEILSSLEN